MDELERNAAGIFEFWAAYKAEDDHEAYHRDDYKERMEGKAAGIATETGKLTVEIAKPQDKATSRLQRDANLIVSNAHDDVVQEMKVEGDRPGAPPYAAQVEAVTNLVNRIKEWARTNKWDGK